MYPKEEKAVISNFFKNIFATTSLSAKKKIVIENKRENEEVKNSKVMKNIEKVTRNYSWNLGMCGYCYGSGFFVFVAPSVDHIQCFDKIANMKGDNAAIDFYLYISEMGAWLPIVYAISLEKGLQMLNEKLARPITPEWRTKVEKSYDVICEDDVAGNSTSLSGKVNEKMIKILG